MPSSAANNFGLKANPASKYYLTNGDLLPEVIKSKELGKMTDKLARMLMLLVDRYSRRPNFNGYSFKQDMVSEALVNLVQNALKFDPAKSSNPFAFYTTAIHHSFLQYMNGEKKQRNIRDSLLIEAGENPSYNFESEERRGAKNSDDAPDYVEHEPRAFNEELEELKKEIDDLRNKSLEEVREADQPHVKEDLLQY